MEIRGQEIPNINRTHYSKRKAVRLASLPFLLVMFACGAAAHAEDTRRLIELTSLDNILRTNAEQAGFVSDHLATDLPPELRTDLRRAVDASIDYNKTAAALAASITQNLDRPSRDWQLQWWSSPSGREIAKAEASVYAGLFEGSSYEAYNPASSSADPSNAGLVDEIIRLGEFPKFINELLQGTGPALTCLRSGSDPGRQTQCLGEQQLSDEQSAQLARFSMQRSSARYLRVPSADLQAYLSFLKAPQSGAGTAALRTAAVAVNQESWRLAATQADSAVDHYAKTHFGRVDQVTLHAMTENIDAARDLRQTRFTLDLMERGAPPNASVLVQLARVTLKLAPQQTYNDTPPSVPQVAPKDVEHAQAYLDKALRLTPVEPYVFMIAGHIAYLQYQFQKSIDLLEKAQAMGTKDPWLHVNLGDALFAIGRPMDAPLNPDLGKRAAQQFETALQSALPPAAESRAVLQLGPVYAELGNIPKADSYYRRYAAMQEGRSKAYALQRYGRFLLFFAKDEDSALAAAREAVQTDNFSLAHELLVQMLTIKAGSLVSGGHAKEAAPLLSEARSLNPDLESLCPDLARLPAMYPGVVGIHAAGVLKRFSGRIGGLTLVHAAVYATPAQIEQLLSWGADPNYLDPEDGTPLHVAILADNPGALKVLLTHGANPSTPFADGRLPCQMEGPPGDTKRKATLEIILHSTGGRCNADPTFPFKVGHEYVLKKDVDGIVNGMTWAGDPYKAGEHVVYQEECRYTDASVACLLFKRLAMQDRVFQFAIARSELASWKDVFTDVTTKSRQR